ncbi:hypothetical protein C8D87_101618 [Lentzea atacamensis]|uniref:Uncharacterized protein n=3 Tax=Lentzea TaxID=165301 RepID=A0ABX9EHG0_9PSEU|nr:hypothetical protein C8D87_101618 [Lentzea atacamensis]
MVWAEESAERGTLWPLVDAMRKITCLADRSGRNLVARMVCDELREQLPFEEHKQAVGHLYSLAEVCTQHPKGLTALQRVLERIEQGSKPMAALRAIVAEMTALEILPAEETKRLFTLLHGVVVADIADIYETIAGPAAPRLREQTTYLEVFRALETMNSDPSGIPKPLLLVEHIAARVRPELAIELRRWVEHQAIRMDLAHELKAVRDNAPDTPDLLAPPPRSAAYLLLQLQREGATGDRYRLSHWRQLDLSQGWSPHRGRDLVDDLEAMKEHVAALIEEVEENWGQYRPDIHIEIILPSEIISLDVDQWPWETDSLIPEPIGCRYPLVVRSLDRMVRRKWHRSWHARWEVLVTQLKISHAIKRDSACWSRASTGDGLRELMSNFERKPKLVSLVLSAPPQVEKAGQDEVAVGLRAGVPLIVWHREKCDSTEFVAMVEELLHGEDDPHHLLERVRLARATAFQEGSAARHVCEKLTILFDDPARVVVPVPPAAPEGVSVA